MIKSMIISLFFIFFAGYFAHCAVRYYVISRKWGNAGIYGNPGIYGVAAVLLAVAAVVGAF